MRAGEFFYMRQLHECTSRATYYVIVCVILRVLRRGSVRGSDINRARAVLARELQDDDVSRAITRLEDVNYSRYLLLRARTLRAEKMFFLFYCARNFPLPERPSSSLELLRFA